MNIEKIEIKPNQYVWVDKEAEILLYCLANGITYSNSIVKYMPSPCPSPYVSNKSILTKIIAASSELNLDGVPSYVEFLADIDSKNHYKDQSDYWAIGYDSYKRGYQARDKEIQKQLIIEIMNEDVAEPQPTWDDVKKAIELARDQYWDVDNRGFSTHTDGDWSFKHLEEEIIKQLKQSKK